MEVSSDLSLLGENFEMGRVKDDDYESQSRSDNFDGASSDDGDADENMPQAHRKKKYHKHLLSKFRSLKWVAL
ncbi:hypothetical protein TanjilG_14973 [Lupinus angustifolius]|uniref:Uncharacterized protein n=1 Tax=Lupinus angustifolius TaxID=3871 RepID=A0A4P1RA93_LUPAN|nr:hypothetical protein TanjilG_14973 [Lupinus angustifolius]